MTGCYFPHLDGLRAIALLGVLGFHFEVPHFSGGYVGVDCFFVLSAYLMTRNISQGVAAGRFSLREFYIRRIWRLLPASVTTMFFSLLGAFAFFTPDLAKRAGNSAIAAVFSLSNVYFWMQGNYFDTLSNVKPLLHTWSLSVEEQFYLVYPPLLLFSLTKYPKNYRYLQAGLSFFCALSLIACKVVEETSPSFAFYALPTRLFGFALGGLLYTFEETSSESCAGRAVQRFPDAVSTLGFGSVLISFVALRNGADIAYGIPASIGFMALITTPQSWVARNILCAPLMQLMGVLSYSAYLVHWPIYVYFHLLAGALPENERHLINPVLLTLLTFAFAGLLRVCVEQPCRTGRPIIILLTLVMAVTSLGASSLPSGWGFRSEKAPSRPYQDLQADFSIPVYTDVARRKYYTDGSRALSTASMPRVIDGLPAGQRYVPGLPTNASLVLVGSSYALHNVGVMYEMVRKRRLQGPVIFFPGGGCTFRPKNNYIPSDHGPERGREMSRRCADEARTMKVLLKELPTNTTVLIADVFKPLEETLNEDRVLSKVNYVRSLGLRPAIMGPPPRLEDGDCYKLKCLDVMNLPLPRMLMSFRGQNKCQSQSKGRTITEHQALEKLASRTDAFCYESPFNSMCSDASTAENCTIVTSEQHVIYTTDNFHLTYKGSLYIGELMASMTRNTCLNA